MLFAGELSFQVFINGERVLVNLAKEERAKLDSIQIKNDVKAEKSKAEIRALSFERSKAVYDTLNQRAMRAKDLFNPYSELIAAADKEIDRVWEPYYALVERHQALVKAEFTQRRKDADTFFGRLSGIQFGVSASLMAIMLAFFATLVHTEWKNVLLSCAYIAQLTACTMIYHGAMLQFDNELQAFMLSFMFFACTPLGYHWGTILWKVEEVTKPEKLKPQVQVADKPDIEAPKLKGEVHGYTEEESLTYRKTFAAAKAGFSVPIKPTVQEAAQPRVIEAKVISEPETWVEACQMKAKGSLKISIREIADKFGVKKWQVEAQLREIQDLVSPSKGSVSLLHRTGSDTPIGQS